MEPFVVISILNWNSWEDTIECLESLQSINYSNFAIVIVDNNSQDGSIEKIKQYSKGEMTVDLKFSEQDSNTAPLDINHITEEDAISNSSAYNIDRGDTYLIEAEENHGFPGGNNLAWEFALDSTMEYLLMLNNDVEVSSDFLSNLVKVGEENKEVGILGSKIKDYHDPDIIQGAGGKLNLWMGGTYNAYGDFVKDTGQFDQIKERDYVWGTSCLVKREVIEEIGYLDDYFFIGIEELDYCTSAKRHGYKILYVPSSEIWHKGGASVSMMEDHPETLEKYLERSGIFQYKYHYRLCKKHLPPVIFIVPFLIGILWSILRGGWLHAVKYILGIDKDRSPETRSDEV